MLETSCKYLLCTSIHLRLSPHQLLIQDLWDVAIHCFRLHTAHVAICVQEAQREIWQLHLTAS